MIKKDFAFTLAETLITLVIVGIVAALTIPNLIVKYQKEQTVIRLKKAYSEICQAVEKAKAENGDVKSWDFDLNPYNFFEKYLYKHFIIIKKNSFTENKKTITYKQISGKPENAIQLVTSSSKYISYTLSNGTQLFVGNINFDIMEIYIDINGYKKPNTIGKDLFVVFILKTGEVIFVQRDDSEDVLTTRRSREQLLSNTSKAPYNYQCNKSGRGLWCGALIQKDGWRIADDYPW